MNNTTKWIIGIIVIVIIIAIGYWVRSSNVTTSTEPIKIGFIAPLTGDAANVGQNIKAAVEIAVEEVNAAGGVQGRQIEVIYEDGQCTGKVASTAANKLINIDKVVAILGGACSGETQAFTGIAEQAKVPVLTYCSSAPLLSEAGDYIFRNYPSDLFQGSFGAEYLFQTLNKKKVAVLYAKSDWGNGIKDVFTEAFRGLGGEIVAEEGYEQTSRDLRSQLTKIKAANPEAVYFLGYTEASIPGIRQVKELGITAPLFGGDAWDDSKIWTETKGISDGAMYSLVASPLNDAFKAAMRGKVGNDEITVCTPQAYDGLKILAQVIENVGTDTTAIKDGLYETTYGPGVSASEIRFDENGDLIGALYMVKRVENGVATEVK